MFEKKKYLLIIALCLGFFMVIMDASIVNVALPSIGTSFHAHLDQLKWVVTGYILTFSCFLIPSGRLADKLGAKKILITGLSLFLVASTACALAPNINLLIIFRVIQGATAATLIPASLTLINATYKDKKSRAKVIGIWGAVGGIAAASSPVLSGLLTTAFGWSSIFYINIPMSLFAIYLIYKFIDETKSNTIKISMFPIHLFKIKNFSLAVFSGMLLNISLYGQLFDLPLYFEKIRHYSVLETGFAILPLMILVALSSYLAGKVAARKGEKLSMSLGFIIGMLGFFSLLIVSQTGPNYIALILPLMTVGFGSAFTMPAATLTAIQSVPKTHAGFASGVFTTSRQLGSLIGVSAFGAILSTSHHFVQGFHITLIVAGVLYLLGFIVSCFVDKSKINDNKKT